MPIRILLAVLVALCVDAGTASAQRQLYVEAPTEDPILGETLTRNLVGPYPLEGDLDALGAADVFGGPQPELLVVAGAAIGWFDFESEASGAITPLPPAAVTDLVTLDAVGDASVDLVAAISGKIYALDRAAGANAWTGPFSAPVVARMLAAVDVDGDGQTDLVTSSGTRVYWLPRGDLGQAWGPMPAPSEGIDALSAVDVSAAPGGIARVLAAYTHQSVYFWAGPDGNGPAAWVATFPSRFRVASATPFPLAGLGLGGFVLPTPEASLIGLTDEAASRGLGAVLDPAGDAHCPGAVLADLNGDLAPDVYFPRGQGGAQGSDNRLYWNDGSGQFTAADPGDASDPGNGAGAVAFDYDGDADLDLYVVNFEEPNALYENRGGSFVDVTAATDPTPFDPPGDIQEGLGTAFGIFTCPSGSPPPCKLEASLAAAAGDFDRDGNLDLYVGNHQCCGFAQGERDVVYLNLGDGRFFDVTLGVGLPLLAQGQPSTQAVIVADLNDDGWPDVYNANKDSGPTRDWLLLNLGDPEGDGWNGFAEWYATQPEPLGSVSSAAMGVDVGDIDGDGDLDVFITDIGEMDLYRNLLADTGEFALELASPNPMPAPDFSWGTSFVDLDADGLLDLHVSSQEGRMDWLYRGTAFGPFDRAFAAGAGVAWDTRASLPGDVDVDGLPDLLLVHRGDVPPSLLRNTSPDPGHWLQVHLVGAPELPAAHTSSATAVGARIQVFAGGRWLRRDVLAGGHTCASTAETVASFGLGDAADVALIWVTWPSGRVTAHFGIAADQRVRIHEAGGLEVLSAN